MEIRQSMRDNESVHEKELGGKLLAAVSRSFYLTLKALPKELREPVSLAYLLARTADTIADTAAAPACLRKECLIELDLLIQKTDATHLLNLVDRLRLEFAPHQTDEAERRLMEKVGEAFEWMNTMHGQAEIAIKSVLATIIEGQRLDIERFPSDGKLRSLETAEELHQYTWLVAGCVGEFWTRLCASELEGTWDASVSIDQMIADGVHMGKGLQLVNILRDVGKDRRLGRVYLPAEEWRLTGIDSVAAVVHDSRCLRPTWSHWVMHCREHLEAGLNYVCRLRHGKLRYATALPLFLAQATLKKLDRASWPEIEAGVKINRIEVAKLLAETLIANRSEESLRRFFAQYR